MSKIKRIDILSRKKEIKSEIANGYTERALKRLIDFTNFYPPKENEAILLSSRHSTLQKQIKQNKITNKEAGVEMTKIKDAVLQLVDEIVEEVLPNAKPPEKELSDKERLIAYIKEKGTESVRELVDKVEEDSQKIIVQAENLSKAYKSSDFLLELNHLELRLGEITAVVGENATGKTCLLRIIAGDLVHDTGILQYPLFQTNGKKHLNWVQIKPQIAYVPQELPAWRGSLLNNLQYEAAIHGIKGKEANSKRLEYILERLGLSNHIHKTWRQLSGGYKLRFALAKALIWKAQLLVIDEPLAHLDIRARWVVLKDLQNLAQNLHNPIAILISSQDLHETETVADNVLFVREGEVENMGKILDWNADRSYNVFEFACDLEEEVLKKALTKAGFSFHKLWYNDSEYLMSTDTTIEGAQFLQFFAQEGIALQSYRNISHSIKTKFYEKELF